MRCPIAGMENCISTRDNLKLAAAGLIAPLLPTFWRPAAVAMRPPCFHKPDMKC